MLNKIIETDENINIEHIKEYIQKMKIENIKGCECKKVYHDFLIFCEKKHYAQLGYFSFRKILMSEYDIKAKQIRLNNDERVYIFY